MAHLKNQKKRFCRNSFRLPTDDFGLKKCPMPHEKGKMGHLKNQKNAFPVTAFDFRLMTFD